MTENVSETSTTGTITMNELRAATNGPSDLHRGDDRFITTYWLLPGGEPDYAGHRQAAKLTITYDKGIGYSAELSLARIKIHDGEHGAYSESFAIGVRGLREQVLTEPATRFNRNKFFAFTQRAYRAAAQDGAAS